MELAQQSVQYAGDDRRWIAGEHGLDDCEPITLDGSLFTDTSKFPDGRIMSGLALGRVTSTQLVGPYDGTASDGRQTCIGLLLNTEMPLRPLASGPAGRKITTALFVHGAVFRNLLPFSSGPGAIDSAAVTALPLIRFRNV